MDNGSVSRKSPENSSLDSAIKKFTDHSHEILLSHDEGNKEVRKRAQEAVDQAIDAIQQQTITPNTKPLSFQDRVVVVIHIQSIRAAYYEQTNWASRAIRSVLGYLGLSSTGKLMNKMERAFNSFQRLYTTHPSLKLNDLAVVDQTRDPRQKKAFAIFNSCIDPKKLNIRDNLAHLQELFYSNALDVDDINEEQLLIQSIRDGKPEIAKWLIQLKGVDLDQPISESEPFKGPLYFSLVNDDLSTFNHLVAKGAEYPDGLVCSLVHAERNLEMTETLLGMEKGPQESELKEAFVEAVLQNDADFAELLMENAGIYLNNLGPFLKGLAERDELGEKFLRKFIEFGKQEKVYTGKWEKKDFIQAIIPACKVVWPNLNDAAIAGMVPIRGE